MATVTFSPFIQHHVGCTNMEAPGNSVREVLASYFQVHRGVQRFILDDENCLRARLTVSVDGILIEDRIGLSDPVHVKAKILVHEVPLDSEYEELGGASL
jgi:hypothetical protein